LLSPSLIHTLSLHDALPISLIAISHCSNHLPSFYSRKITGSAFTQCLPPQPIISIYIDESRYSHATNGVALGGRPRGEPCTVRRSEEHTSELQSRFDLVCRL